MFQLKKRYKLLLIIAVILILTTCAYAHFQPPITSSSDLTNPNSSDIISQNDSECLRRESSVSNSKTKSCLTCNDTGTLTKTIENYLTCPVCAGTGKITCPCCDGSGHLGTDICIKCLGASLQTCPDCDGKGYKSEIVTTKDKCPDCISNKH